MNRTFALFACLAVCAASGVQAIAAPQSASSRAAVVPGPQGIFLVFPFENDGAGPRLDWLCEGLEELTIQRLTAAGQKVYTHAGRASELDRYGLPSAARFSHATMLRIGADLDADFVVFGKFNSDGKSLAIETQLLRVSPTALAPPVRESGSLASLMELHNQLAWKLLAANDKGFPLNEAEFANCSGHSGWMPSSTTSADCLGMMTKRACANCASPRALSRNGQNRHSLLGKPIFRIASAIWRCLGWSACLLAIPVPLKPPSAWAFAGCC